LEIIFSAYGLRSLAFATVVVTFSSQNSS